MPPVGPAGVGVAAPKAPAPACDPVAPETALDAEVAVVAGCGTREGRTTGGRVPVRCIEIGARARAADPGAMVVVATATPAFEAADALPFVAVTAGAVFATFESIAEAVAAGDGIELASEESKFDARATAVGAGAETTASVISTDNVETETEAEAEGFVWWF